MELEITPQPGPDERSAIEAAVERALSTDGGPSRPWWDAGIRESTGVGDDEEL